MKKLLLAALVSLAASSLSAAPVLVEAYNEKMITIPEDVIDTVTVVELSFSVDTTCYVLFTAGALVAPAKMFLQLDGSDLYPISMAHGNPAGGSHITYTYLLTSEAHTIRDCPTLC
ncbi:MAG: hypothetical protein U9Q76_06985 [candidate division WOR-3 bacterium]|nr:hypothetical protein [candidate division WOR-3 bacterium]